MLVKKIDKNIPFNKITVKMLKNMDYGQTIKLNKNFSLSNHSEEKMIDIFHTKTWTNLYAVLQNNDLTIEFEQVYNDLDTL